MRYLIHTQQFEAIKSASGWTNCKMRALKDHDDTYGEEEIQRTVTMVWTTVPSREERMED